MGSFRSECTCFQLPARNSRNLLRWLAHFIFPRCTRMLSLCVVPSGFKQLLVNPGPVPIESFIQFGDQFFTRCISPTFGGNQGQTSPRSLLVRWSFVTSQIMRDLTLRSAPTFGSFAIASTFFNEFLGFQASFHSRSYQKFCKLTASHVRFFVVSPFKFLPLPHLL